jgi:hypothetical protein
VRGFDTPDEVRLLVDAGSLGYLSIAAHGHADALSFVLKHRRSRDPRGPGHLRLSHRSDVAPLLPQHTRAQHRGVDEQTSPCRPQFHVDASRAARCIEFETGTERQRFVGEH